MNLSNATLMGEERGAATSLREYRASQCELIERVTPLVGFPQKGKRGLK